MVSYEHGISEIDGYVKARRPWAVAGLGLVTFGIYWVVWYYRVNREMRDYGSEHGDQGLAESKPWYSVLAVTVGGVIVIPELVSLVRMVGRLREVERIATGEPGPGFGLIALLIGSELASLGRIVHASPVALILAGAAGSLAAIALIQSRLNTVWQEAGAVAQPPLDATEVAGR